MNNDGMQENFVYERIREIVADYIDFISDNIFTTCEYEVLNKLPENPEELVAAVETIVATAKNLNQLLEHSPTSIYVADANGRTLRINKCFEELSHIKRKDLLGRKTSDLENEAVYWPSVVSLVLKEGRRVAAQQTNSNSRDFFVTGTPVFDENGNLIMAVTNAILNEEIKRIGKYLTVRDNPETVPADNEAIISHSPTMQNIFQLADLVKDTSSTIMIEGETGVGKNVLARYIHNTCNRSTHRMIEVNCGAIPENLLESELFGYDSGAFTGAKKAGKPGLIELCDKGTILLDEIGEMPMFLQVKLLHFLQNKKVIRVGGTNEVELDVRVIATTNKSLEDMVAQGTFREDLYYRLNVVPIIIPPLRERKEDLLPMAQHFVDKYTRLYSRILSLNKSHMESIIANSWHGNIRELENYIERLVITEGNLELLDKSSYYRPASNSKVTAERSVTSDRTEEGVSNKSAKDSAPICSMEEMEKAAILDAYNKYGSSYKVAEALGMSQSTAYRKIKKYLAEMKTFE